MPGLHRAVTVALSVGFVASLSRASARAEVIYAMTATNLVWFDTSSPGTVHNVGPLGVSHALSLTFNPTDQFLYTHGTDANGDLLLYRINPLTGAASTAANLGQPGFVEAIEWVGSRNSLVISQNSTQATRFLCDLSMTGVITPLVSNGRDNDFAVWDSNRDLFYVMDPNGANQFTLTDLSTGANTNLGAASLGDLAYSAASDCFYATSFPTNSLRRIQTTNGLGPITVTNLGTIGGDLIQGMALVPSPGTVMLASIFGTLACRRRARLP